jgi:hypothetical protein
LRSVSLLVYRASFCDGSYLEFVLQSRASWAYYPARLSPRRVQ